MIRHFIDNFVQSTPVRGKTKYQCQNVSLNKKTWFFIFIVFEYFTKIKLFPKNQKSNPGKPPTPMTQSIPKQTCPASPNIREQGKSLTPAFSLPSQSHPLISPTILSSYFRRKNILAILTKFIFSYGNNLWICAFKNMYPFPEIPWQRLKPFLRIPLDQIHSNDYHIILVKFSFYERWG